MDIGEGGTQQRLNGEERVFAGFDGSYGEDETRGKVVERAHASLLVASGELAEASAATLIDDVDAVFGELAEGEDVALGALGDGDDALRLAQRGEELAPIEEDVDGMIVFGMAKEDEVVDGDKARDASLAESTRQFARESVEEVDAVALEAVDDST